MGWLDELDEPFPEGETVVRLRRKETLDPYSGQVTLGDWTNPDEEPIDGAFVAQSSTSAQSDAARNQLLEEKSLYLPDPAADVNAQDRIRAGGITYTIDGMPTADRNPWTGWQPVREVPLKRGVG